MSGILLVIFSIIVRYSCPSHIIYNLFWSSVIVVEILSIISVIGISVLGKLNIGTMLKFLRFKNFKSYFEKFTDFGQVFFYIIYTFSSSSIIGIRILLQVCRLLLIGLKFIWSGILSGLKVIFIRKEESIYLEENSKD